MRMYFKTVWHEFNRVDKITNIRYYYTDFKLTSHDGARVICINANGDMSTLIRQDIEWIKHSRLDNLTWYMEQIGEDEFEWAVIK